MFQDTCCNRITALLQDDPTLSARQLADRAGRSWSTAQQIKREYQDERDLRGEQGSALKERGARLPLLTLVNATVMLSSEITEEHREVGRSMQQEGRTK